MTLDTAPTDAAPELEDIEIVEQPSVGTDALPGWFTTTLVISLTWIAAAGIAGVLGLYFDVYQPALVVVVASVVTVAIARSRVVPRPTARVSRTAHVSAAAALAFALAFMVFAGAYHSEHLLADRDPAIYLDTGRSIARTHELRPRIAVGVYADRNLYSTSGPSLNESRDGRLEPNFFPMLPALLALSWSFGGDHLMLLLPALLGALGLLALYALAARVVGTKWAIAVPLLLALEPLQLWFARDAYSELVVQPLVLAGIWLLIEGRNGPSLRCAVAGSFIAATALARIDSLVFVASAIVATGYLWLSAPYAESQARRRAAASSFGAALAVGALIAVWVTHSTSRLYIRALDDQYHQLVRACEAAVLASVVAVVAQRVRPGIGRLVAGARGVYPAIAVATIAVVGWAATLRVPSRSTLPVLTHAIAAPELRAAANSWHWRWSVRWFIEYFGVVAVVLAVAGVLYWLWLALRGDTAKSLLLLMVVPCTLLYLARPSISPDQPWVMRRYLPVVLPAVALAVIAALRALLSWRPRSSVAIASVVALVVAVAVPAAAAARPFARMRMQDGAFGAVRQICAAASNDAAIFVLYGSFADDELPTTLSVFCGVPTAKPADVHRPADLTGLARDWTKQGRRLIVVSPTREQVEQSGASFRPIAHLVIPDGHEPLRRLDYRPRQVMPRPLNLWVYEIAPGNA